MSYGHVLGEYDGQWLGTGSYLVFLGDCRPPGVQTKLWGRKWSTGMGYSLLPFMLLGELVSRAYGRSELPGVPGIPGVHRPPGKQANCGARSGVQSMQCSLLLLAVLSGQLAGRSLYGEEAYLEFLEPKGL